MNNPKMLKIVIAVLAIALIMSLLLFGRALRHKSPWESEAVELANFKGSERALCDFQAGKLRLFVLGDASETDTYSGSNDGPFEIWIPQYFPPRGPAHRISMERWIEVYNHQMRDMHDYPEKFMTMTNTNRP
jgi:hypothetical protein